MNPACFTPSAVTLMVKSCLTVDGADEGEAGEDPQEGHGSIMLGLCELGAFILPGSNVIGRDRTGHVIREGGSLDRWS